MKSRTGSLFSRRNVLRGAGVCVALPWLESLLPRARALPPSFPKRFLPIYFPNGADAAWWDLGGTPGSAVWGLSAVLSPFADLKHKLILFDGLSNYRYAGANPGALLPPHAKTSGAFLSCVDVGTAATPNIPNISADQQIAGFSVETSIPSLQLGLSSLLSSCDGLPCDFSRSISFAGGAALPREIDPQAVFDRMFGGADGATPAQIAQRWALDQSVLDYVQDTAGALQLRLGADDRVKVDEFLSSVRDVELNVGAQSPIAQVCQAPARPTLSVHDGLANGDEGYDRDAHAELMNDLIVLALQCDVTRVISHMLDDSMSDFIYNHVPLQDFGGSDLGLTEVGGFHAMASSNAASNPFASINFWLNQKVASLCGKLDAISEGEGTLLDHTAVFYASHFDGIAHEAVRIPSLLIGGGDTFKSDQWLQFPAFPGDPQFRDLYLTIMNAFFGMGVTDFGADVADLPAQMLAEVLA